MPTIVSGGGGSEASVMTEYNGVDPRSGAPKKSSARKVSTLRTRGRRWSRKGQGDFIRCRGDLGEAVLFPGSRGNALACVR